MPSPAHPAWLIRRFDEIDSTNRYLLDEARGGAPEGLVAVADFQTAGRGRLGRTWEAQPGDALLMSVLLRPDGLAADRRHLVVAAVAVAACEALDPLPVTIKWPNDLLLDDRKLAGVLAEAEGDAVVVGIGINLRRAPDGAAAAGDLSTGPLLGEILGRLAHWYGRWDELALEYRRRCSTIGAAVRVELSDETFTGTAADINAAGHLLVDVGTCLREVVAGDVVHVRPTT